MKPGRIKPALLAILLAVSLSAQARDAAPQAALPSTDDPVIEQRLVNLAEDLRCLVCQNESRAALAEDLRREIRTQMMAGKNDREVVAYLTERYGDFVLYRPPFKPVTWLLWLGPVLFLGIGGGAWYLTLRRRRDVQAVPLDEKKRAAAAQLLEEK
ncbi:MAG: cytochrome c-type biogenesis protein CcmH [Thiobacillus sp.]|nr:cytochrome c-type biogenesis protein CcmH [Thiobacillus sp.]